MKNLMLVAEDNTLLCRVIVELVVDFLNENKKRDKYELQFIDDANRVRESILKETSVVITGIKFYDDKEGGLRLIKSAKKFGAVVIATSGDPNNQMAALEAGADFFIEQPSGFGRKLRKALELVTN